MLALVVEPLVSASMNRNGPGCFFAHSDSVIRTDADDTKTKTKQKQKIKEKGEGRPTLLSFRAQGTALMKWATGSKNKNNEKQIKNGRKEEGEKHTVKRTSGNKESRRRRNYDKGAYSSANERHCGQRRHATYHGCPSTKPT